MKEELVYLGVDIAKSFLDVALSDEKRRFANNTVGHRQLIHWIKQMESPVQVICEPSGGYERAFVRAVARAQITISLVQANRVRQFARAAGILAKTDRCEGAVRFWSGHAAVGLERIEARARAFARTGESTASFNASAGDGAKSSRAIGRQLRAAIKPQSP